MRSYLPQIVFSPGVGSGSAPLLGTRGQYVTLYRDAALSVVEVNLQLADGTPLPDGRALVDATSRTPRLQVTGGTEVPATLYAKPDGSTLGTPVFSSAEETLAQVAAVVISAEDLLASVSVKAFGATGNGTSDDTAAIMAAQTSLGARGGVVVFPPGTYRADGLAPAAGVTWTSLGEARGKLYASVGATIIKARASSAATYVIDTSASNVAIKGLQIDGNGRVGGIRLSGGTGSTIKAVHVHNTDREGIYLGGLVHVVEDVLVTNPNMTAPSAQSGAVIVAGTDHVLTKVEASGAAAPGALSGPSKYKAAFYIPGTNNMLTACQGELGDVGFVVAGGLNKFAAVRADLNYADGFIITGSNNTFVGCGANNNGQDASNTYDGYVVSGTNNAFAACHTQQPGATLLRYGVNDSALGGLLWQHNHYAAMALSGCSTGQWKFAVSSAASGPVLSPVSVTSTSATPDVNGAALLTLSHATATTITNFLNGTPGQRLLIKGNSNVTIQNNSSTIFTNTANDRPLANNRIYRFTNVGGIWFEDQDNVSGPKQTLAAVATDLTTTTALANSLRAALLNLGLAT